MAGRASASPGVTRTPRRQMAVVRAIQPALRLQFRETHAEPRTLWHLRMAQIHEPTRSTRSSATSRTASRRRPRRAGAWASEAVATPGWWSAAAVYSTGSRHGRGRATRCALVSTLAQSFTRYALRQFVARSVESEHGLRIEPHTATRWGIQTDPARRSTIRPRSAPSPGLQAPDPVCRPAIAQWGSRPPAG
jgi:hypothetical protein